MLHTLLHHFNSEAVSVKQSLKYMSVDGLLVNQRHKILVLLYLANR